MHALFDFLRRYNHIFVFLILEVLAFTLLFRHHSYQSSVWLSAANGVASTVNGAYNEVEQYFLLKAVNKQLTEENVRLHLEHEVLLAGIKDSLRREQLLVRMAERLRDDYEMLPARVVSSTKERANPYLVIDRGENDGVRPEMGVVGGNGIVGIVYKTTPHHALVIPVTNTKSSISCRIRGQGYFGYLTWAGGDLRRASLTDIPRYAGKMKPGTTVETSGYSAVFPPGLPVGKVVRVSNSADGQSYTADVKLGTDFARIRDVMVVTTTYKPEIDTLRTDAARLEQETAN
ncbi:MAG: rod shape-determining protein MreC [Prevotellaceae bacterium]|nr:rod shape-determining protein MreC [Prevotellaceae bacterium]